MYVLFDVLYHSPFCPLWHYVPFDSSLDNFYQLTFFPSRPFLLSTLCLFGVLSRSTFCPFDIFYHSTFCHSAFCPIRCFVLRPFLLQHFVGEPYDTAVCAQECGVLLGRDILIIYMIFLLMRSILPHNVLL
jgi:hypothetical protein